jgi:predicted nucleotidyltransferase
MSASEVLFPAQYRRKALALLMLRPERRLHLREIARLTGTQPGTMAKELQRLHEAGLLTRERVGNQVRFGGNVAHPVFGELAALLRKTVGVADVLADALATIARDVDVAFVFGSVARGEERPESDLDLAVIGRCDFAAVSEALDPAERALGREINPKVYSAGEWRKRVRAGSSFVKQLLAEPKIFVVGTQGELEFVGEPGPERAAR